MTSHRCLSLRNCVRIGIGRRESQAGAFRSAKEFNHFWNPYINYKLCNKTLYLVQNRRLLFFTNIYYTRIAQVMDDGNFPKRETKLRSIICGRIYQLLDFSLSIHQIRLVSSW